MQYNQEQDMAIQGELQNNEINNENSVETE